MSQSLENIELHYIQGLLRTSNAVHSPGPGGL